MSENGPYNQPPQNPHGGGEPGGQPPYGPPHGAPYGDPGTGGQPGYGPGYHPGPEQQVYTGGHPGYGPGGAPGTGGQPGYGPGYHPGYMPQPQPPKSGGRAVAWILGIGGAVIVVLLIAVVAAVFINGQNNPVAQPPTGPATEQEPTTATEPGTGSEPDPNTAAPTGEPPYAVPAEPCDALTDQVYADFMLTEAGYKSVQDSTASCHSSLADAPEGNPEDSYASLRVEYAVPYSASDSLEAAEDDYEYNLEYVTGANDYSAYLAEGVEENREVDLGDQAHYVLTTYDYLGDEVPTAVLLIRTANVNIQIEYQVLLGLLGDATVDELSLPDNTEDLMFNAGNEALALVGSA
ncbi:hypothetical protein [Nocardiopsis sp. CNT312]|uniref:hypothetical protein n=1 Tax=Nocardiopsis sp. CNT312 TaxID=1137268 RepID=UPI00048D031D|nr:hypothetical protein [Nocardiopsis sp. CNT312]